MVFLIPLISLSIFLRRFLFLFFFGTESSLTILSRSFLTFDSNTGTKFSTEPPRNTGTAADRLSGSARGAPSALRSSHVRPGRPYRAGTTDELSLPHGFGTRRP